MADVPLDKKDKHAQRGIPAAVFVEDVDKFMQIPENTSAEVVLKRLDEQHSKYKFMEANLVSKRRRLRNQIPEIEKSLDMIAFLRTKKGSSEPMLTHYMLSDSVFASAEVLPTETVDLWLGANVMLEYPIEEATALLENNLSVAQLSLEEVGEDLDYISDQCTIVEVAMTRVYNWDVKGRRQRHS